MASAVNILPNFEKWFVIRISPILVLLFFSFTASYSQQYAASTCSGTSFFFTQPGAIAGTTYSWPAPVSNPSGAITGTAQNSQGAVAENLLNNTAATATATYTVTPSSGPLFTLVVTVNPTPALTSSLTPTTCSGSVFTYTPTSAVIGASFDWVRTAVTGISNSAGNGSGNPNEILLNTTINAVTVNYSFITSANGCIGNSQNVSVLVNPLPVINNTATAPTARCSGTAFNYTPTSAIAGANLTWARAAVTGISNSAGAGANNPNEILINTTSNPLSVNYVFTTSANGCNNNQSFPVLVNPLPTLSSSQTPSAICSGSFFNYTPTSLQSVSFNWSRVGIAGLNNGNPGTSGLGNPGEFLVNSLLVSVTATYAYLLTNSTTGCTNTQTVSVNVNPVPSVLAQTINGVCSGTSFLSSPGGVPNGTLYTWATPVITAGGAGSISGGSAVNTGQSFISQTLTNNTASAATIRYTVTPNTNGCIGTSFLLDVTVNPGGTSLQISNPTGNAVCSGNLFNYQPTSTTGGVSYTWKRFLTNGISNTPANGSGPVNEFLINTTSQPVTVNYAYTITDGNGCSNTQTVPVAVNPTPVLSTSLSPVPVCSNAVFSYVPTSATTVSSFTWTRGTVAGISNPPSVGSGPVSETLINTTTAVVNVSYSYTLTTASGCTNTQLVTVQVNPSPTLSSSLNPAAVCGGTIFNYSATSITSNVTFSWARSVQASISNSAGSGAGNISEILVNTAITAVPVTYNYTLTANGCSNLQVVNATVNPTPAINNQVTTICNNTTFSVTPANVPAGTQYTWATPVISPVGTISNGSAQASLQNSINNQLALVNISTNNATATYTVTPKSNTCTGAAFNVTVTVNATPVLSSSLTPPTICSNVVFNYTPTSSSTGTSFTWTRGTVAGISNPSGGGTGSISETLINITSLPVNVIYTYSLSTSSGCTNIQTVTVQLNPSPTLSSSSSPPAICSGSAFSYTPQSNILGTVFSWTRAWCLLSAMERLQVWATLQKSW